MDAQRSFSKQASALRNIPSINDFNTLTNREDLETDSSFSSGVVSRSWSMESTETPHKSPLSPSKFAETFTRALYEHMRGN
jgi:hypothetical protein